MRAQWFVINLLVQKKTMGAGLIKRLLSRTANQGCGSGSYPHEKKAGSGFDPNEKANPTVVKKPDPDPTIVVIKPDLDPTIIKKQIRIRPS